MISVASCKEVAQAIRSGYLAKLFYHRSRIVAPVTDHDFCVR